MNLLLLSWRYLWSRPLNTALNLVLLALGLATVAFVLVAQSQIEQAFERDLKGIDAVVGAKGSPMQLILSGVFHVDAPTGNISQQALEQLRQHPQVAQAIPVSLGDNLQGFRIVGTTADYPAHYGAELASGQLWSLPMEAVLGAQVAQMTGLSVGKEFAGAHGLGLGGAEHSGSLYRVVGVLTPCSCVLDRLALTATESVWQVHEDMHATEDMNEAERADMHQAMEDDREVTLALVRYRSPVAALSFPRFINSETAMQAASPAQEVSRLLSMIGVAVHVVQGLGVVLLGVAALSVFIALWAAVRERGPDIAMLRMLGASPFRVGALLMCESLWLALLACGLGLLIAHGFIGVMGSVWMNDQPMALQGWAWTASEWWVPMLAVGVGVFSASVPAISAYRVDVTQLLSGAR